MKSPLLTLSLAILFLAGCVNSDPNVSKEPAGIDAKAEADAAIATNPIVSRSGFDNAKTVSMVPHSNTQNSTDLIHTGLGAQWNAAHPDDLILIVEVSTLRDRRGITATELTGITGAELNIDGEKIALGLTGTVPDLQDNFLMKEFTNGFATKLSTLDKILKSKRAWLRVYTPTGTVEGAVVDNGVKSGAYNALEKFMAAVMTP